MAVGGGEAEVSCSHWSERCGGGVDVSAGETDMSGGAMRREIRVSSAKMNGVHIFIGRGS